MIQGILRDLYQEAAMLSQEVIHGIEKAAVKRTGKKDFWAEENSTIWVGCIELYMALQLKLPVQEDWLSSDEWVVGVVTATMDEIKGAIDGEIRGLKFEDLWATLEDTGAVAVVGGVVRLPHLAGKIATLEALVKHRDRERAHWEKLKSAENTLGFS